MKINETHSSRGIGGVDGTENQMLKEASNDDYVSVDTDKDQKKRRKSKLSSCLRAVSFG